jgi:hypothetical protein
MPFAKGNNANPKGRPPTGKSIAEYIRKLGGENGKLYVDILHGVAVDAEQPMPTRLTAMNCLLDRGFGKPPQDVNLGGTVDTRTTVVHEYHDTPPTKPA